MPDHRKSTALTVYLFIYLWFNSRRSQLLVLDVYNRFQASGSWHGMCRRMQASYAEKVQCSGTR